MHVDMCICAGMYKFMGACMYVKCVYVYCTNLCTLMYFEILSLYRLAQVHSVQIQYMATGHLNEILI